MKNGHVIFLNGTSSSGKTSIARALQEKLPAPYMYVSVDSFFHLYPDRFLNPANQKEMAVLQRLVPAVLLGLHRTVAALAQAGNNVLVDHVLQEEGMLQECVESWAGLEVLFVGVRCPLEIAEERERERGDRNIGTARYQFERVHRHDTYDLEIDTSLLAVDECVERIIGQMSKHTGEPAFQRLRARYAIPNESAASRGEAG